ncbi:MAG: phosphatidylserine/phosphatidylglycerophosphate/cardiolipin synthase family protein [Verrucomicrobia bacterium]|nr:phosphatidylserine/phosphatidylglycerophosphate/cardiolipin synthase family protein [Verrucomicrobiota bacterium]
MSRLYPLLAVAVAGTLSGCNFQKSGTIAEGEIVQFPPVAHGRMMVRATAGAVLADPLGSTVAGGRMLTRRTLSQMDGVIRMIGMPTPTGVPEPGSEAFEVYLDQRKLSSRTWGKVDLLVDGNEFFPEFIRSVEGARSSVDSQVFIFDNDDWAVAVADVFKRKSREVPTRILIDNMGSRVAHMIDPETRQPAGFHPPPFIGDYLRDGSEIEFRANMNPFFLADHCKIHIIDGRQAFIGGMNIGREYRSEWHDAMMKLEGPVVLQLAHVFKRHWQREDWLRNWTLRNAFPSRKVIPTIRTAADQIPLRVLRTDVATQRESIAQALHLAISGARRRVWIHTPYLTGDEILGDLTAAVRRGVDVRVIIPGTNDSGLMHAVNFTGAHGLIREGARFYSYPKMCHLKACLIDGWGMFGSANFDTLSLRLNRELNVASSSDRFTGLLEKRIFLPDFGKSARITEARAYRESLPFLDALGNQL